MPIVRAHTPVQTRRRPNYRRHTRQGPAHAAARALAVSRGLGDCAVSLDGITCPDGSSYSGELGGFAPIYTPTVSNTGIVTQPASSGGPSVTSLIAGMIPAGFTTLQEAIAQPGQVVKTPSTLITGANTNLATIPGLSTVSGSGLMIGALVIGGLVLFSMLGKK